MKAWAARVCEIMVVATAAYAFFMVPLGPKTPFRHMVAIFSTEPAKEALQALEDACERAFDDAQP